MIKRYSLFLALLTAVACSSGDGPVDPPIDSGPGPVSFVTVGPTSPTIQLAGQTVQLTARAADGAGATVPNQTWTWSSDDPSVLTIDQSGIATALAIGTATVTATTSGKSGTLAVQVTGPMSLEFLDGSWTVTRSDGATATTAFTTLTGGIREEVRTRDGVEILRSLTRVEGTTWYLGRADAERRRMQYFVATMSPGQTQTIATSPDDTGRIILENVSTTGFTIRIQSKVDGTWTDEITEEYVR